MCAEEAAVVETQDGRENRVIVHHPRIADYKMILVDRRLTDNDLILQGLLNLLEELAVQRVVHDLIGIAVVGQPVEIAVPPDQVVCVFGTDLCVECIVSCARTVGINRIQRCVEVLASVLGILQIVLIGKLRTIRIGIAAVIAVEFVVHIPAQPALCVRDQLMCVDERGNVALFQSVILGVALYDEQALVVVPRVNLAQIGLRALLRRLPEPCSRAYPML